MTSIVAGMNYAVLFGNQTAGADPYAAILSTVTGGAAKPASLSAAFTASSTGDPLADLRRAQRLQTAEVARISKDPLVARDLSAFRAGVAKAGDIAAALADPAVLKVLLTANNLGSQTQFPALARKVLLSDPTDPEGLARRIGNPAWLNAVKTYDFKQTGLARLRDPAVQATLTEGYAQVAWRQALDRATPGLGTALAFVQQARRATNADEILGDPVNRAVVTTALGIPKEIAFQPLTAQENAITARLEIARLQDAKFVAALAGRYLLARQQEARSADTALPDLATLAQRARGGGVWV